MKSLFCAYFSIVKYNLNMDRYNILFIINLSYPLAKAKINDNRQKGALWNIKMDKEHYSLSVSFVPCNAKDTSFTLGKGWIYVAWVFASTLWVEIFKIHVVRESSKVRLSIYLSSMYTCMYVFTYLTEYHKAQDITKHM